MPSSHCAAAATAMPQPVKLEQQQPQLPLAEEPSYTDQETWPSTASEVSHSATTGLLDDDDDDDNSDSQQPSPPPHEREAPSLDWTFQKQGQLYDRQAETQLLQAAFYRRLANNNSPTKVDSASTSCGSELILVSGHSGTGKTVLARNALKQLVQEHGGHFIMGKFDQLQTPEPYAPFVTAFTQLVMSLEANGEEAVHRARNLVLDKVGRDACSTLRLLVPALDRLLGPDPQSQPQPQQQLLPPSETAVATTATTKTTRGDQAVQQDRLKVTLKKFIDAVCSRSCPLVLVMDDLQWADTGSLELLEALAADASIQGLVVVGICRSNEVPWHHDFAAMLRRLEDHAHTTITNVEVRPLSWDATNQLLSDVLHQPLSVCTPLTNVIHAKTQGNVFFTLNFIKALHEDGVLVAEPVPPPKQPRAPQPHSEGDHAEDQPRHHQWMWRDDRWHECFDELDLNIVELVSRQIRRLPQSCQVLLKVAACMGAEFDHAMLTKVLVNDKVLVASVDLRNKNSRGSVTSTTSDITADSNNNNNNNNNNNTNNNVKAEALLEETLRIALEEELILPLLQRDGRYAFAHDRIQQAAYALIPEEEQAGTHLLIGRSLFTNMSQEEVTENIYLVVNQMIRGVDLLQNEDDRVGLASLCLQAGRQATLSSDFNTAVMYHTWGTELLPRRHWRDEYQLSLELYNSLAEAECCAAEFDKMDEAVEEILANALSFSDKTRAYFTKVYAYNARFMLQEAIDLGLEVLNNLGEGLPSSPRLIYVIHELIKTKMRLRGKTDEDLLNLPDIDIDNSDKIDAMNILNLLTTYTFIARPQYFPFVTFRLMKLSLKYGLCAVATPGFAFYGLLLCALGDIEPGFRYGKLALKILERFETTKTEWIPRVYVVFYGLMHHWKEPMRTAFEPLLHAHAVGRETGDFEYAMIGAHLYGLNAFMAGQPLAKVEGELTSYVDLMTTCKQGPWLAATALQLHMVQNLMGMSDDPLALTGDMMEEGAGAPTSENLENYKTYQCEVFLWRLLLAYHFGDLPLALKMAKASRGAEKILKSSYMVVVQFFLDGMTSLASVQNGGKRSRLRHARFCLKKLEKLATHCPPNIMHKIYLMKAEFAVLKMGNLDGAMSLYNQAIDFAAQEGFIHIQALACERAGLAQRRGHNEAAAVILLRQAVDLYFEWGAHALVHHIKQRLLGR